MLLLVMQVRHLVMMVCGSMIRLRLLLFWGGGLAKDGKFANTSAGDEDGKVKAAVKASGWIKEMHKAVEDTAKAGEGGGEPIANVADGGNAAAAGTMADAGSVTGIAKGMKAIVDAAVKAGVEFKPGTEGVAGGGDAGKLFASGDAANNAAAADAANEAQKAAAEAGKAVSAVSGDQILKAIVDAAGTSAGKSANAAKDAVAAAIGADGAAQAFAGNMQNKNDQIAAAIVLRGLAKDGKFANTSAGDADGKVKAAVEAGKAVSAVSGDQILKAIVDAAEKNSAGKSANAATNAVAAAIGEDGAAAAFADGGMRNKYDQIAAAIVLRGLAKDGKFANTSADDANAKDKVKAAVKSAGWIKEMHKAVEDTAKAGAGDGEPIANVATGGAAGATSAGAKADKDSVTGIAKGMKAIVDAAGKAGVEFKPGAEGGDNGDAGRLFASGAANGAGDAADAAQKAAAEAGKAVSAVSGDQILKAIVDAAGTSAGANANAATNAVEAAIGEDDGAGQAFGDGMRKYDQIAAAIVLRGLAKDGKFANVGDAGAGDADKDKVKAAAEAGKAVSAVSGDQILKATVGAAGTSAGKSANAATNAVAAAIGADGGAGQAFGDGGMRKNDQIAAAIVLRGLAKDGKFANVGAADEDDKDKVKAAADAGKAVSAVSGDQILKATVGAAGTSAGAKADEATNAVAAAIGADGGGAAFAAGGMQNKNDQIAAAIVLRGLAKGGKFANTSAVAEGDGKANKDKVKAAVKSAGWIKEMHKAVEDTAKAGGEGGNEPIANVANAAAADANANNAQKAAADAGKAVSAVSGDQILKAIVDAAGTSAGANANEAKDAVAAAIGEDDGDAQAFGDGMRNKNDQIAAAIVLRGLAKGGKFANVGAGGEGANQANKDKVKAAVKSAVESG
ncbi:variable large family protein (plasmid) [Borreliella andersonii]|uniref:Variable large family protein n=1 Tax=Borrelia andersonii TaxID=42109 RepID=A0ACD5G6V1_BORAD